MTKAGRIGNVFLGLIMILFGIGIVTVPANAYPIIIVVLGFSLLLTALRHLVFYFTMARHMVDGRRILYRAVIELDVGLFTLSLTNVPLIFLILYLAGIHGFSGIIDVLRGRESRRLQAPSWKLTMSHGIVNIIIAGLCLACFRQPEMAVIVYSGGLMYSGAVRIVQAFRRTAVIYIN